MGVTVAEMRALALALPEAVEIETWGHPTFRVRNKMFASCASDDTPEPTATFKATLDEQAELLAEDPGVYGVPAYVGHAGWVQVRLEAIASDVLREHLMDAWRRTAPKRVVAAFDATLDDA
ncbi:MmcQ/YjbR family DNA-binding protein [Cryptosporangium minutisporangium]|uniref:MmcQ/YjbR family DNA-binding protein n=1 Tax=Cryptosporangium minutisporangium TaxID=113569 RepID=A0ABP6T3E3_9ACTN